jgi:hypothetical protein
MKKFCALLAVVFLAAFMYAEPLKVTINEVVDAYSKNQLRADSLYKGKEIQVTGIVREVTNLTPTGRRISYHIILADQKKAFTFWGMPTAGLVYGYFEESELESFIDLNKGQVVTIVGTCTGASVITYDFNLDYVRLVRK